MLLDTLASALLARRPGQVVRGEPYFVGERRLTPIARLRVSEASAGRVRVGTVQPLGFVEEVGEARHWIGVGGGWGEVAARLAAAGLPVLFFVVVRAIVRARRSGCQAEGCLEEAHDGR